MEKRSLVGADVDECRLKSRKHRVHLAPVNVADHPSGFGTVDLHLNELVVLQNRYANLALRRADQNLSFHRIPHEGARTATRLRSIRSRRCG